MFYSYMAHQSGGSGFFLDSDKKAPTDAIKVSDDDAQNCANLPDGSAYDFIATGEANTTGTLVITPPGNEYLLASAKADAVKRMEDACAAHIIAGIDVGDVHYPTTRNDQADINGLYNCAMALGDGGAPYKFMCAVAGIWSRRDHTADQIKSVALAVSQHVIDTKNALDVKLAEIDSVAASPAITPADLNKIVW